MCRNIHTLHNFDPPATEKEVRAAALQYVRKISGSTRPSKANEAVFDRASSLRVYPQPEALLSLLKPLETQVFAGNQVSRTKGDGIEFADN